jgi:hypothetical protein
VLGSGVEVSGKVLEPRCPGDFLPLAAPGYAGEGIDEPQKLLTEQRAPTGGAEHG